MTQPQRPHHVWHQVEGLYIKCSQCAQVTADVSYEFPEPMLPETEQQIIIVFYHPGIRGTPRRRACVQYFSQAACEAHPWECHATWTE